MQTGAHEALRLPARDRSKTKIARSRNRSQWDARCRRACGLASRWPQRLRGKNGTNQPRFEPKKPDESTQKSTEKIARKQSNTRNNGGVTRMSMEMEGGRRETNRIGETLIASPGVASGERRRRTEVARRRRRGARPQNTNSAPKGGPICKRHERERQRQKKDAPDEQDTRSNDWKIE